MTQGDHLPATTIQRRARGGRSRGGPGRVLVIGGTGFIGSEIVLELLGDGAAVGVMARNPPSDWRRPWLSQADLFIGSAGDPIVLSRALMDVDWVVYAATCPPPSADLDPDGSIAQTVPSLISVLDALCERPGVGLTYLSSGGTVYGNPESLPAAESSACVPISAYGITKLLGEKNVTEYASTHRVPVRILRIGNAYGPLQSAEDGQGILAVLLDAALTGGEVSIFGDGRSVRDYVHVADVAKAVAHLEPTLDEPQVINVGSGTGLSIRQLLEVVEAVTDTPIPVRWSPQRSFDVRSIVLDLARLNRHLEWKPRDIETGIAQMWEQLLSWQSESSEQEPA
ncbi:MAG TPA: NAD-dependent epimerase/dehydratase family protein [Acidimicrobiales bacterium]|nr:NAD-dependent epimerase/dehydratase family protein [Acidimicrobiales bacterium]